jgi:hypothetical protein
MSTAALPRRRGRRMLRLARIGLVLIGVALVALAAWQVYISAEERIARGTVSSLRRALDLPLQDNSNDVYYRFTTVDGAMVDGTYLLENPTSIGDMPRLGTAISVRYLRRAPAVNTLSNQPTLITQSLFLGEFLFLMGGVLLVAGFRIR